MASVRKRAKQNQGLPSRWRLYHGAYYYRVPPGFESQWVRTTQFRLGTTPAEAATEWAKRMSTAERSAVYVRELLDRYALDVIPHKAPATQARETTCIVNLRKVFGEMRLVDIEPQHTFIGMRTLGLINPARSLRQLPGTR